MSKSQYLSSKSKPKTTVRKTASKALAGRYDYENAQLRSGVTSSGQTYGPSYDSTSQYYNTGAVKQAANEKSSSSKSSSSSSSKKNSTEAKVTNAKNAQSAADLATYKASPAGLTQSIRGGLLHVGKQIALGIPGIGQAVSAWDQMKPGTGVDITNAIGINPNFKTPSEEEIRNLLGIQSANAAGIDVATPSPTTYDPTQVIDQNGQSGAFNKTPVTTSPLFTSPTTVTSSSVIPTRTSTRTSHAVSNPTPASTPFQVSSAPAGIAPTQASVVPDTTPVVQEQPGTTRQFLGNGYLSNGVASNGKGDYGIEGTMTGTQGNTALDDLLTVLGIKPETAMAAEIPMNSFDPMSSMPQTLSPYSGAMSIPGQAAPYWAQPTISDNQNNARTNQNYTKTTTQNPGGSQGGGVTQQFSQGSTGGSPLEGYYKQQEKGYSAQEKAQKRALNELLKSIKNQYKTQTKTGTTALEKAKQEDLLKLAGLFSGANQDAQSEQRIQYEQRANKDYANQLAQFLAQISQQQGQAISQAKQGYQSQLADIAQQRNATSLEIAKLRQDAIDKAASRRTSATNKNQTLIQQILNRAANMPYGGREYAQQQANMLGLGNIGGYTPNGWENAYNPSFGQPITTAPTRSTNPLPEQQYDGTVIDANPWSPTYGMEMVQE